MPLGFIRDARRGGIEKARKETKLTGAFGTIIVKDGASADRRRPRGAVLPEQFVDDVQMWTGIAPREVDVGVILHAQAAAVDQMWHGTLRDRQTQDTSVQSRRVTWRMLLPSIVREGFGNTPAAGRCSVAK